MQTSTTLDLYCHYENSFSQLIKLFVCPPRPVCQREKEQGDSDDSVAYSKIRKVDVDLTFKDEWH